MLIAVDLKEPPKENQIAATGTAVASNPPIAPNAPSPAAPGTAPAVAQTAALAATAKPTEEPKPSTANEQPSEAKEEAKPAGVAEKPKASSTVVKKNLPAVGKRDERTTETAKEPPTSPYPGLQHTGLLMLQNEEAAYVSTLVNQLESVRFFCCLLPS